MFSYQQRYELEPRPRETNRKVDGARAEITRSMAKPRESVGGSMPQPFSSLAVMRPKMEAEGGYPGQGGTPDRSNRSRSFRGRLRIMEQNNNKLSPERVHGGARAAAGACVL